jgi:hypothetical protein
VDSIASDITLYGVLAEPAPGESEPGETVTTKAKETVDNDVEAFAVQEVSTLV